MPNKLGQNFLKNKDVVGKIIDSADLNLDDFILEVGPGKGILTEELVKKAGKVIAVEIDKNLVEILEDKFKRNNKIEIIEGDIIKNNVADLISKFPLPDSEAESALSQKERELGDREGYFLNTKYKVIANIPYYITSPIIRFFLENEFPPEEMILMVQKEVAERIVAKPGNHSILSLSVQYYANPELLFYVNKNDFDPVPEVDSAVIKITNHKSQITNPERDSFFRVVRAGFCAKRKMLVNNIANSFHLNKKEVEEKLKSAGISGTARAQELNMEDWKKLVSLFSYFI